MMLRITGRVAVTLLSLLAVKVVTASPTPANDGINVTERTSFTTMSTSAWTSTIEEPTRTSAISITTTSASTSVLSSTATAQSSSISASLYQKSSRYPADDSNIPLHKLWEKNSTMFWEAYDRACVGIGIETYEEGYQNIRVKAPEPLKIAQPLSNGSVPHGLYHYDLYALGEYLYRKHQNDTEVFESSREKNRGKEPCAHVFCFAPGIVVSLCNYNKADRIVPIYKKEVAKIIYNLGDWLFFDQRWLREVDAQLHTLINKLTFSEVLNISPHTGSIGLEQDFQSNQVAKKPRPCRGEFVIETKEGYTKLKKWGRWVSAPRLSIPELKTKYLNYEVWTQWSKDPDWRIVVQFKEDGGDGKVLGCKKWEDLKVETGNALDYRLGEGILSKEQAINLQVE